MLSFLFRSSFCLFISAWRSQWQCSMISPTTTMSSSSTISIYRTTLRKNCEDNKISFFTLLHKTSAVSHKSPSEHIQVIISIWCYSKLIWNLWCCCTYRIYINIYMIGLLFCLAYHWFYSWCLREADERLFSWYFVSFILLSDIYGMMASSARVADISNVRLCLLCAMLFCEGTLGLRRMYCSSLFISYSVWIACLHDCTIVLMCSIDRLTRSLTSMSLPLSFWLESTWHIQHCIKYMSF